MMDRAFVFKIPDTQWQQLSELADRTGMSKAQLVRTAIDGLLTGQQMPASVCSGSIVSGYVLVRER